MGVAWKDFDEEMKNLILSFMLGEQARIIREEEKCMLVEGEKSFIIIANGIIALRMHKKFYSLEDALKEFEDFVRC